MFFGYCRLVRDFVVSSEMLEYAQKWRVRFACVGFLVVCAYVYT